MRQEYDFLQILPAQPGFWVLETLPDENGAPYALHRHAVVGWGLDRDFLLAFPITIEGPQDSRPILRPDGLIEVAFGGFHHSEVELLIELKQEWTAMRTEVAR